MSRTRGRGEGVGAARRSGGRRRAGLRLASGVAGLCLSALGFASAGCKSPGELDQKRKEMLAAATPCPAPATCTGKATAVEREVATCSALDTKALAAGDVVIVKELAVHDTIARVKSHEGDDLRIEFVDGYVLERGADKVVARICR